jgi:hypothetical protein
MGPSSPSQLPPHKAQGVGNERYGPRRLELALRVRAQLERLGVDWFLDGGTLLGAWRNGRVIPHDDDFDMALYLPRFGGVPQLHQLQRSLSVPAPYAVRVVTTYAYKLEIYDSRSEAFTLPPRYGGADFHTVTVDLQIMTLGRDGLARHLHDMLGHAAVPPEVLLPTGEIECEGHRFRSPHDVEAFLQAQYGYLGTDARFDPASGKYVPRT